MHVDDLFALHIVKRVLKIPFNFSFKDVGLFPHTKSATVLWVSGANCSAVSRDMQNLAMALPIPVASRFTSSSMTMAPERHSLLRLSRQSSAAEKEIKKEREDERKK